MRVFVAGATGVIGQRLVPRLVEAGHTVTAMTRNLDRAEGLAALGADPVECDVYDTKGLEEALRKAKPDVVIHQLTALPKAIDPRKMEKQLAPNDRIRTEGTRNLVRAAVLAGARRIVAQSVSFVYTPQGGPVKDEDAPLWLDAPWPWRRSVAAVAELERQVRSAERAWKAWSFGMVISMGPARMPGSDLEISQGSDPKVCNSSWMRRLGRSCTFLDLTPVVCRGYNWLPLERGSWPARSVSHSFRSFS